MIINYPIVMNLICHLTTDMTSFPTDMNYNPTRLLPVAYIISEAWNILEIQ